MNTDMPDIPEEANDVVPGGGPAEGEDATLQMPNPDAVHPDYAQTVPGSAAPAPTTEPAAPEEPASDES